MTRKHLIHQFGVLRLDELTGRAVRKWIGQLTVSPKHVNNILTPLRMVYAEALTEGEISSNPMITVVNLPVSAPSPDPFELSETKQILDTFAGQVLNFFQFAFWTGLRPSEQIELKWTDVDWRGCGCSGQLC